MSASFRRKKHRSDLQGEAGEADSAEKQREQDDLEAERDFWSISRSFIHRHHVQERQKQHVTQESSFTIPLKFFDVVRLTSTTSVAVN